jgi:AcrR family transcriptional regulator
VGQRREAHHAGGGEGGRCRRAQHLLHFTDKTELVWAALSDKYEQLAAQMRAADEAAVPDGPRARLLAEVYAYCRFALDNPGHYRLMYEVRQPAVDPARLGLHPARLVSRNFRRALAEGLVDILVAADPVPDAVAPAETDIERLIAAQDLPRSRTKRHPHDRGDAAHPYLGSPAKRPRGMMDAMISLRRGDCQK